MRALTWHGQSDIRCETVPDPKIEHGRDAIIKVTVCAICGSDLHLFDGIMPTMEKNEKSEIDPSFVITHRVTLEHGPGLYKTFRAKEDGCIKVVRRP